MHPDLLPHATALRAVPNLVRRAHLHDESTVQRLVERAVAAKGATVFGRGSAMSSDAPRTRWSFLDWWRQAETAAEIPRTPGLGFHSLRRAFATELKGTPLPDLQYMGEWKSAATLLTPLRQRWLARAVARVGPARSLC